MKPKSHSEQLLEDILEEGITPAFRAELLDSMLVQARQKRRRQSRNQALLVATLLLSAAVMAWRWQGSSSPHRFLETQSDPVPGVKLISSLPLAPSMVVHTRPASVTVVDSAPDSVVKINTGDSPKLFREISDSDLFALLEGRPAALVRQQGHPPELLFLNPADRDGFVVR